MTTISFRTENGRITGFECRGHSGFGCEGQDIVCAAVTSAVRLVECALGDVMGLKVHVKTDAEQALISLRLPGGLAPEEEETSQTLLSALMVYLAGLREEYPDNIDVLEV
ncbi:ribosomal-processing cysteine protease Prp [Papillibacter cinnamivorans]|uniref:Ribosomal processing cysteine protease Prp n=1 Tax=Papillibacter cinnamivorans DSM 12816 TaxID=1122930 RepID=A0A1W2BVS0_9FIRM|nr:ribosomal-processing cysteine protease Prp [Papillibacter cinnamivorans]SMC76806.1 hypothetical protein SAMN02745168_2411 [Papillibacter cinnamivorans DSM 12816]